MAVIEHHDRRAARPCGDRAGGPIAGHPDGRITGEHQRFVADLFRAVQRWINAHRAGQASSVAARQAVRLHASFAQPPQHLARHVGRLKLAN